MSSESVPQPTPISVLDLSRRAARCLQRAGHDTVDDIVALTKEQLLTIPGIGDALSSEIREKLARYLARDAQPPRKSSTEPSLAGPSTGYDVATTDEAPIQILHFSDRLERVLRTAGVATVGELLRVPLGQFVSSQKLGRKGRKEIEKKLGAYLAEHPGTLSEPPMLLADRALLRHSAAIPLDSIPLERLALPTDQERQLQSQGIETVGELIRRPVSVFDRTPGTGSHLELYLSWLIEQEAEAWEREIAAQGISPLHQLVLAETTLRALADAWLSPLRDHEDKVIRWRYGMAGERLTLEAVSQNLGFNLEHTRQVQHRALSVLKRPHGVKAVAALKALLVHLLTEAEGLMGAGQLEAALNREMIVGEVNAIGVVKLLAATDGDLEWLRSAQACGLTSYPVFRVKKIHKRLVRLLAQHGRPLSASRLLTLFKQTKFFQKHQGELSDSFLLACLRIHPNILTKGERCIWKKWTGPRLEEMETVLRKLDRPAHYKMIAERVNRNLPRDKKVSTRRAQALMKRRPDVFVHIEQGIFGLKEWGRLDDFALGKHE